jgi:UDP-N-acetylmuramoyl-L-alanyl-D-glutamate--2,6-diaminopimelate ligase
MTSVRGELQSAFSTVAVTGTNGKSTTTSMLASIVRAAGEPSVRVTTLGAWLDDEEIALGPSLEAFARAIEAGARASIRTLALEVTSRALAEGFAHHWPARVAVFTNLSRDHLDYHGEPERYLAAKAQLFMTLPDDGFAVLNAGDPASALLGEVTPPAVRRLAFAGVAGVAPECSELPLVLRAHDVRVTRRGTRVSLATGALADALGGELRLRVIGAVNAENALAAAVAAHALGYAPRAIGEGLEQFRGIAGRFEVVWPDPLVVVDYAHTPDALERTLEEARVLAGDGRVLCVFGCGGGSDPGKRPEMGRVAASLADEIWLTSDNPRNESAVEIIEQIAAGARAGPERGREGPAGPGRKPVDRELRLVSEPDRRAAIERSVAVARPGSGDIVLVAGKGHEKTQCVGDDVIPFDDAQVARAACRARFESEEG